MAQSDRARRLACHSAGAGPTGSCWGTSRRPFRTPRSNSVFVPRLNAAGPEMSPLLVEGDIFLAISEFPKWRKYLILLSFLDNSSDRPVQIGGVDVNICHSRVDRSPRTPAVQFAIPSAGAILSHTDGPCGS